VILFIRFIRVILATATGCVQFPFGASEATIFFEARIAAERVPRPGTVLRRRKLSISDAKGAAVQLPVAARQAPSSPAHARNGEILKDATAVDDIFFQRRERDRPARAFVQGQVLPPKSSVD